MYIQRDFYIEELKTRQHNGLVKIITGLRRCGKTFLLFTIFKEYLLGQGVTEDQIIEVSLDTDIHASLRDPDLLSEHIRSKIVSQTTQYYLFIDEAQFAITKEEMKQKDNPVRLYSVLNGLIRLKNVDIYITGSNSKFLSKDVLTSFRGRGDEIHVHPLSFKEFYQHTGGEVAQTYETYERYGGMPFVVGIADDIRKGSYLSSLVEEIYIKDIIERYAIEYEHVLRQLIDLLFSTIGSLTNANRLTKALISAGNKTISQETVASYMNIIVESFLFSEAKRFDVKGKRYFSYPSKFYATDIGIRNARLNYRQQEPSHLMENIIYNELIRRGYTVDVGMVELKQNQVEVDFIANKGPDRVYIQSALMMEDLKKIEQEKRSLVNIPDNFPKIIITRTLAKRWVDEDGIIHLGLYEFLLEEDVLR